MYTRSQVLGAAFVAAFALASAAPAHAAGGQRGTMVGVVIDTGKQPVAGAEVTLVGSSGRYSTKTDNGGKFHVMGVDVDTYNIRIHKDGYSDAVISGVDALGDQTQDVGTVTLSAG
jgi:protocatechuate 3,4-dioxygenase beta subunit